MARLHSMQNASDDPRPATLPRVRSRERRLLAILTATIAVVALVSSWLVPSDADLLERARSHPDVEIRIDEVEAQKRARARFLGLNFIGPDLDVDASSEGEPGVV